LVGGFQRDKVKNLPESLQSLQDVTSHGRKEIRRLKGQQVIYKVFYRLQRFFFFFFFKKKKRRKKERKKEERKKNSGPGNNS
jgi:hypothetical protein